MGMHTYWDLGNQIYWDTHRERVVYAIGPGVEASVNIADAVIGGAGEDPVGWVTTVVEGGAGLTELSGSPTQGIVARITNAGNESDGGSYQAHGQTFRCVSSMKWYAGIQFTSSEETQIDMLFGVAITDTALLGSIEDAVYIETLDAGTGISVVAEKGNTETQTDNLGTMTTSKQTWEMFWTGTNIHYYLDGALVANVSSGNIPDDVAMRVSLEFLNGEVVAHTLDIHWLRAFSWS